MAKMTTILISAPKLVAARKERRPCGGGSEKEKNTAGTSSPDEAATPPPPSPPPSSPWNRSQQQPMVLSRSEERRSDQSTNVPSSSPAARSMKEIMLEQRRERDRRESEETETAQQKKKDSPRFSSVSSASTATLNNAEPPAQRKNPWRSVTSSSPCPVTPKRWTPSAAPPQNDELDEKADTMSTSSNRRSDHVLRDEDANAKFKFSPSSSNHSNSGGGGGRGRRTRPKSGGIPPQNRPKHAHRSSSSCRHPQQHHNSSQQHRDGANNRYNNSNQGHGHNNNNNRGGKFGTATPTPSRAASNRRGRSREQYDYFHAPVNNRSLSSVSLSSSSSSSGSSSCASLRAASSSPSILPISESDDVPEELYHMGGSTSTSDRDHRCCDDISSEEQSRYVSLDCEMVGSGPYGDHSLVARVCVVDWNGHVLLDTFVKPTEPVTDYRTFVSGVRREDLESESAMELHKCRSAVGKILRGRILVGHALHNDMTALELAHPWYDIRDTARYAPYMAVVQPPKTAVSSVPFTTLAQPPSVVESDCSSSSSSSSSTTSSAAPLVDTTASSGVVSPPPWEPPPCTMQQQLRSRKLRELAMTHLGLDIQSPGCEHSPVEDANAALGLYKLARVQWERVMNFTTASHLDE